MDWLTFFAGLGIGSVVGFFLACACGLARKASRQDELEFWRYRALNSEGRSEKS